MNNLVNGKLLTAIELRSDLKADLLNFLDAYRFHHPDESERLRVLIGVIKLHDESTRDFLKYSDFEILSIIRKMVFHGYDINHAIASSKHQSESGFIMQTLNDTNRAVTVARIWRRLALEQMEEIKTKLTGIHSIDFTKVRLENHQSNESYRLSLIQMKSDIEQSLNEYDDAIYHAEQVRKKISEWLRYEAPANIRDGVHQLNDTGRCESLDPYVKAISEYANMNE